MKEIDAKLEVLMGKLLDGEITPAEQQVLNEALQRDAGTRELFAQMRLLSECSRDAVATEIAKHGRGAEEILRDTAPRSSCVRWLSVFRVNGHLRFAAGLAAGFLLGLLLHFALVYGEPDAVPPVTPRHAAQDLTGDDLLYDEMVGTPAPDRYRPTIRNVDWYGFTDNAGRQWLLQGVREGIVHPAVNTEDLY